MQSHGFDQRLTLIAAVGRNGVIGDGAQMPWHLPEDLRFFKKTTMGGVLVMGRGTWDSIGRALRGRRTIVVTRDKDWSAPGAEVAHSLREALLIAGDGEVFIAGGGQVYAQTIEHAHRLILTEIDLEPQGTTRFPDIDPQVWREVARIRPLLKKGNGTPKSWVEGYASDWYRADLAQRALESWVAKLEDELLPRLRVQLRAAMQERAAVPTTWAWPEAARETARRLTLPEAELLAAETTDDVVALSRCLARVEHASVGP